MIPVDESKESLESIFVGDSEMARLMLDHDWSTTSLGNPRHWPQSLKVAVRILLSSRFEMWLGWGPDIAFLYNDAYRPTLGQKHPKSLGMPTRVLWKEIWDDVEPRLRLVYERGEATWDRALLLVLHRSGFPEETYHTFSYSPLLNDVGRVEGVFCAVTEETERVISERRLASLRTFSLSLAGAHTVADVFAGAAQAAKQADRDILFSAAYAFEGTDGAPTPLYEALGAVDTLDSQRLWPLGSLRQGTTLATVALPPELPFATGAWDVRAEKAAVIALHREGDDKPSGALVIGLNPLRPFDEDYQSYVRLLAGQIATRWSSVGALEAIRQRAEALGEALRFRQEAAEALNRANQQLADEVASRTQERDRLRALFKQAPSFMALLTGPDHVFELVNDAYMKLVGHRELIGLTVKEALPEVEGQGYFELLDSVFRTGEPFVGEALAVRLQRTPGAQAEERFVNLVYQPLQIDGVVHGIFVDGFDVTHQKHAEDALRTLNSTLESRVSERTAELASALEKLRQESEERTRAERALQQVQKMEALGALTGGVAHDFNNLLQVISGNLQLLNKLTVDNPAAKARVESALNGVARGAKLASQLLSFGRRQPLEPKIVNVGRFIRGMEDMLRRALAEGIEIEIVVSGGLWNTSVDPGQIENAVLNLAINARDAMKGHGRLTIEAGNALLDEGYCAQHHDVRPGQYVMIAVTDTGEGMTPEVMQRAFEPFFSTKPEGKGTGLGLSMVYGFVKQTGGHVMIYSEVGEGTTVKVYLPRSLEQEDVPAPAPAGPVQGGTETILVVEDDEDVREIAVATLAELGYRVLRAKDADSALTVIDSGVPIDLLFTDVVMPGKLRSPELAKKAKQRLPGLAVLFTSGYTENAIVHGGRLDPGVELLSKPYTREALARRVRHVLANQAQRQFSAAAARHAEADDATRPRHAAPAPETPLRVLLVEDDDLILSATAEQLRDFGHHVDEAGDGQTALRLVAQGGHDVMVVDLGLPDMTGVSCALEALKLRPGLSIVFASGEEVDCRQVPTHRCRVVLKPYTVDRLIEATKKALFRDRP